MAITNLEELSGIIELRDNERRWKEDGANTLPLLISDDIAALLSKEEIRRQFVPTEEENNDTVGSLDPQKEGEYKQTDRLIHRYRNRAAFFTTDRCFAYCRHCFRRRLAGHLVGPATEDEIRKAAEYIASRSEIREVLLTGGDLFTLSDSHLDMLLSIFKENCPDVILRLCTRAVAVNPGRFTPALIEIIKKHNHHAPFFLMTQFNHPAELTEKAINAVSMFIDNGIPTFNQSVLLKGVNDNEKTLIELSDRLLMARIKPYYLFQDDPIKGTAHLRVGIERGLEIEKNIRTALSGLGMPQYTADLPDGGGKVILTYSYYKGSVIENGKERYIFETPEGEIRYYPE